jgi:hypothetical protein
VSYAHDITLANDVRGTFVVPDAPAPMPAVLMLHGFASQWREMGGKFSRLKG